MYKLSIFLLLLGSCNPKLTFTQECNQLLDTYPSQQGDKRSAICIFASAAVKLGIIDRKEALEQIKRVMSRN